MELSIPSNVHDLHKLELTQLNALLKKNGQRPIGNRSYKVTKLCEIYGFIGEHKSFQSILTGVKNNSTGWSKDIRQAPPFQLCNISKYLINSHGTSTHLSSDDIELFTPENLRRYKTLRSYNLYRSGHIHSIVFLDMDGRYCAVKGRCNPSWDTSGKVYDCIVLCEKESGVPVGSNCSCTAGQGEACTHVAALLFSMEDFTSQGHNLLPDNPASTEVLCEWTKPKDVKVDPMPMKELNFHQCTPLTTKESARKHLYNFNPVAPEKRGINSDSYKALVHKLNLVQPNLPFLTIAEPEKNKDNNVGQMSYTQDIGTMVQEDCPYLLPGVEVEVKTTSIKPQTVKQMSKHFKNSDNMNTNNYIDRFIDKLKISHEEQTVVMNLTRDQNDSSDWHDYRNAMITASNIHNVFTKVNSIKKSKTNNTTSIVNNILGISKFKGNVATCYGTANEEKAADVYFKKMSKIHDSFQMQKCGLVVLKEHSFIGATPDRLTHCTCHGDKVVEIKCPISMKDKSKEDFGELKCLKIGSGNMTINTKHAYYSQLQCQMAVTNINCADFIVWSPDDILIIQVPFNIDHWNKILSNSMYFFRYYIVPELLNNNTDDSNLNISNNLLRTTFVKDHICGNPKCKGVLKDTDNVDGDKDVNIQCECECHCERWFHLKCTNFFTLELEEGEDYPQWFCPRCVRNCDIVY